MKTVPHTHPGSVELCYDTLCARVTTEERAAATLGGGLLGGIAGAILTGRPTGAIVGALIGAVIGSMTGDDSTSPSRT